ncbi:MAG: restriction endonuclease subunit R, partial [bacterium]
REGWDNPNVFTICTLKQSDHEIGKRQEVGRGLRISVDTQGRRTDGTEVHDINVLTVVASESYEAFAKGLQDELTEALKGRPTEASVAYFTGKTIQGATGERVLTAQDADLLRLWLYKHDFIADRNHITPKWHEARDTDALPPLPEALAPDTEGVIALVNTVLDPSALSGMTGNGRRQVTPRVRKANLEKQAFQELWSRISAKAVYFTDFDTDRLVKAAVRRLDQDLRVDRQLIIVSGAELKNTLDVEDLRAGRGFTEETARFEHEQSAVATTVRYDLVGELAAKTRLTRGTVGRILKEIRQVTFALFAKNPEMFIRGAAELIRREKTALAIETLHYEKTGDHHAVAIFET